MGSGDDLKIGESQVAENGTELLAHEAQSVDGLVQPYGSNYIFRVEDRTSLEPRRFISGLDAKAPRGFGVTGAGIDGVHGDGAGLNAPDGAGVVGTGTAAGVVGRLTDQPQPIPLPLFDPGVGVLGSTLGLNKENSAGVIGESDAGYGVFGDTQSGVGVRGVSTGSTQVPGTGPIGVLGDAFGVGSAGVVGRALVVGTGVHGLSGGPYRGQVGTGVYGEAEAGAGVVGYSTIGVQGQSDRYVGVYGSSVDENDNLGFAAGYFYGHVIIQGDLTVLGAKSAAIPHRDGFHRLLYSIESPESWLEDFGEAKLVKGKATVKLDPGFASATRTAQYHVFLTPYGDSHGLYVSHRGRTGFQVREQGKSRSSISFSYCIVAKRKDIAGTRLAKVKMEKVEPVRPAPGILQGRKDLPPRPRRRERALRPLGA